MGTYTITDRNGRCSNRNCIKNHCARHWKNNTDRVVSNDLNPHNEFRCPFYLPKFTIAGVDEERNFLVRKQNK